MFLRGSIFLAVSAAVVSAINTRSFGLRAPLPPPVDVGEIAVTHGALSTNGSALPPLNTTYYFDQLIDHTDASKGTFKQRYWMTWNFYEDGGPIVLFTPGEANAAPYTGYLTNRTINGQIAQQQGGATIVLEHRFFGLSNPYDDLTVKSLQLLTLEQSVDDLEYFVKNVKVPAPIEDASKAPWVLVGGSYSGALTAWTMVAKPNLFAAGWASSAVVETIVDFWQYFEVPRTQMPKNCSNDIQAVIAHFDAVAHNPKAVAALKAQFGLEDVEHYDDVTAALKNPIYEWQDLQPDSGPDTGFFEFCDALEVKDNKTAPASGWGLEHALSAWGAFFKNVYLPATCGDDNYNDCLGTYDASQEFYTSTEIDDATRSWFWFVCNEVGWFQDAAPLGHPTIVSRTLQPANQEVRQCKYFFPEAQPVSSARILKTDKTYKGWDLDVQTIFFGNGIRDPWRYSTVSAPEITPPHIPQSHIGLHDGFHTSDLIIANGAVDATVAAVQKKGLAFIKQTLAASKPSSGRRGWREAIKREA
ncbi:peptidase S28 [Peniophora sp. CONT]|nr:peptidase S28 [Peniophora sp. CONT]